MQLWVFYGPFCKLVSLKFVILDIATNMIENYHLLQWELIDRLPNQLLENRIGQWIKQKKRYRM